MIDVSDVVMDEDMSPHSFLVLRDSKGVDADGMATQIGRRTIPCTGSIQPAGVAITGQPELKRGPDGSQVVTAIKIWTTFNLIAGATPATADVIFWNGQHYTVNAIDEWNFGAGYVAAMAVIVEYHGETAAEP